MVENGWDKFGQVVLYRLDNLTLQVEHLQATIQNFAIEDHVRQEDVDRVEHTFRAFVAEDRKLHENISDKITKIQLELTRTSVKSTAWYMAAGAAGPTIAIVIAVIFKLWK